MRWLPREYLNENNQTMNTTNTIKLSLMTFAGLPLEVITGHPDHELLFKATQVARVAGLKDPAQAVRLFLQKDVSGKALQVNELQSKIANCAILKDCPRWRNVWLFDEAAVYSMILRGRSEASKPFRKWVTEEVLPSIRKTGSYNVETSETPEGIQFAAEFSAMRLMLNDLRDEVAGLKQTILEWKIPAPMQVIAKSPYEGQAKANVFHAISAKQYNECAEGLGVSRLVSEIGVTPSHW
ncbi:BRO family protein [Pectobacterium peruviense]|uniref:BRO-N domain-containing protein n=1 Tax=Pectobacterium peruviense TaxID=2066479 RepID=UPI000DE28270|nr:BRO family protein [Pectobacterium peruviense]